MSNREKLIEFLKRNNGYISTADFLKMNISKPLIQKFINDGTIEKVSHGLYMDSTLFKDEYYILQKNIKMQFFHIIPLYIF